MTNVHQLHPVNSSSHDWQCEEDVAEMRAQWSANRQAQSRAHDMLIEVQEMRRRLPRKDHAWLPWALSAGLLVVLAVYMWGVN